LGECIEVRYAPVLAFVECRTRYWEALAIIDGKVEVGDPFAPQRILLPGEELTEEGMARMKEAYVAEAEEQESSEAVPDSASEHDPRR